MSDIKLVTCDFCNYSIPDIPACKQEWITLPDGKVQCFFCQYYALDKHGHPALKQALPEYKELYKFKKK